MTYALITIAILALFNAMLWRRHYAVYKEAQRLLHLLDAARATLDVYGIEIEAEETLDKLRDAGEMQAVLVINAAGQALRAQEG